jgi:hypothetical protein
LLGTRRHRAWDNLALRDARILRECRSTFAF